MDKWHTYFDSLTHQGANWAAFAILVLVALFAWWLSKHVLSRFIRNLVSKTRIRFDDFLFSHKVFDRLYPLIPVLIIHAGRLFIPRYTLIVETGVNLLIVIILSRALTAFTRSLSDYYGTLPVSRLHPVKGYVQVVNLIIYIMATITVIGLLTGRSPWELIAGLGALTAVLLLIFRDTILGLVASVQIAGNDMVRVGDWIEMPRYGADGDVIDIALHTVKVRNWDKTITFIPTYKLIEDSFKNWRGMTQSGARRVKRALYVDMTSIRFLTKETLENLEKVELLREYIRERKREVSTDHPKENDPQTINKRRLTNVGTFRIYAENYLKNHPFIRQDLTCMVRQLKPGPEGLPLEVYAFANTTDWVNYEHIQANIFDHLLSVASFFNLNVFQKPGSHDLRALQFSSHV
ncbi:MAG: mechanosensitive ion channel family protein [Calditrichaeota bacterium]|nr:MAG: mechanosensitive ion channel family protein [Calditrichota bacterium]